MKETAKEEQAQVTMEMISLRQSGDPKDMASATHSLPDVSILIYKHTQATSGLVSILGGLGAVRWSGRRSLSPCLRTLTRPFSNNPASTDSWLGIKKMLCIILPNGRTGAPIFFSCIRTRRLLSRHTCPVLSPRLAVQGESWLFLLCPYQKRRNNWWFRKTFQMLSAGPFQFAPRPFCHKVS